MLFEGLHLRLSAGDALVINGPNGIGKSSLIRMLAGLLLVAEGTLERKGRVALADENSGLDAEKPLLFALQFWARLDGGDAPSALAAMGLDHLADVPVRMFSTGQRKRAGLARVLASNAHIWLLDEPANGLDAESLDRLLGSIEKHRAAGGIVVIASHQPLAISGARELSLA